MQRCRRWAVPFAAMFLISVSARIDAQTRVDEHNVVYGMYSGTALLMDVHYPLRSNGSGVLHISGSGWYRSTAYSTRPLKEQLEPYVPALIEAGYTLFS